MKVIPFLLKFIDGYKTYASVILTVVTGVGLILAKNYPGGISDILQALTVIAGGATVASLRHAVSKVGS